MDDPHKIARFIRGCATDEQYTDLTDRIEAALEDAKKEGERIGRAAEREEIAEIVRGASAAHSPLVALRRIKAAIHARSEQERTP